MKRKTAISVGMLIVFLAFVSGKECLSAETSRTATMTSPKELVASTTDEVVTVRLLDDKGKPVPDTQVAIAAGKYLPSKPAWRFLHQAARTDNRGQALFPANNLLRFARRSDGVVPIYALHGTRQLAGLGELSEDDRGHTVDIRLLPACRVKAQVKSTAIERLDKPLDFVNTYVYWDDHRPLIFNSATPDQQGFEFLLPPGQYKIKVYGGQSNGVSTDKQLHTIEIASGQKTLEMDIDLPLSRRDALLGHPPLELTQIKGWKNGGPVKLADLKGKVVLLDFWGYWCAPCVGEMPILMALHDKYAEKGLVIIGVHNDTVESIAEMDKRLAGARKRIWSGRDLPFLIALDGGGKTPVEGTDRTADGATTAAYDITSFPTTILIDKEGKVAGRFVPTSQEHITRLKQMLGLSAGIPPASQPSQDLHEQRKQDTGWEERFTEIYSLPENKTLCRIAPPFIPERNRFYFHHNPYTVKAPASLKLWRDDKAWKIPLYAPDPTIKSILRGLGFDLNHEIEGPDDLLELEIPGDWLVRENSPHDRILANLGTILEAELNRKIRFERRQTEREVIVARGNYEFKPLVGLATCSLDTVQLFSDTLDWNGSGGGTASLRSFLTKLGSSSFLDRQVINETDSPCDIEVVWTNHDSGYAGKLADEEEKSLKNDLVLANLSQQTSLKLTKEHRTIEVWTVTEAK